MIDQDCFAREWMKSQSTMGSPAMNR